MLGEYRTSAGTLEADATHDWVRSRLDRVSDRPAYRREAGAALINWRAFQDALMRSFGAIHG